MNVEHKKYLKYSVLLISSVILSVFTLNYFVDPLWYFGGNKIFPENYSFNERFSKVNQYLKKSRNYDCILLGSSRVTLLNADSISGYNCFNFSFSDGNPDEFISYSKYIRKFGNKPKLTILGVDARFYSRKKHKIIIPDFVRKLDKPPTSLKTYLSFRATGFSLRTLLRKAPQPRYYTDNLIGEILPGTKFYNPPECFTLEGFGLPYTSKNIHYIQTIKETLSSDKFIGYVAPISAWDLLPLLEDGEINSYLNTMYEISNKFDQFYDFSIPSKMTKQTNNNYDGHHFSRSTNDVIAGILNGDSLKYGVALHNISLNDYKKKFIDAVERFKRSKKYSKKSSWGCPHRTAMR